jgi:DNA-binding NarL/FixJ family response regulator
MVGGDSEEDAGRRPPASPSSERLLRVMIVDDDPLFSQLLLRVFHHQHEWMEVVGCASDGREAVMLASATTPDVVLMDIEMPIVNGIEATRAILARAEPAVIVLTASASAEHRRLALEAGARCVLPKGVDPAVLVGYLRNVHAETVAA